MTEASRRIELLQEGIGLLQKKVNIRDQEDRIKKTEATIRDQEEQIKKTEAKIREQKEQVELKEVKTEDTGEDITEKEVTIRLQGRESINVVNIVTGDHKTVPVGNAVGRDHSQRQELCGQWASLLVFTFIVVLLSFLYQK